MLGSWLHAQAVHEEDDPQDQAVIHSTPRGSQGEGILIKSEDFNDLLRAVIPYIIIMVIVCSIFFTLYKLVNFSEAGRESNL